MNSNYDTPLNDIFKGSLEKIDSWLIPSGQGHPRDIRTKQDSVANWIDLLGEKSAQAQGLQNKLTTSNKFKKSPDQQLYIFIDREALDGKGEMIGILRTGPKRLYFHKQSGEVVQKDAECVLDFYVKADYQRHGIGKKLYDFMLQDKRIAPHMLAIDRPSKEMLNFQKKYYGLKDMQMQANHYAVVPKFFDIWTENVQGRKIVHVAADGYMASADDDDDDEEDPKSVIVIDMWCKCFSKAPIQEAHIPVGRYAAHRPRSQIESVIHGYQQ